jgi:hypothetical protein
LPGALSASDAAKAKNLIAQLDAALADGRAAYGRGDYATWAQDQSKVDDYTQQLQSLFSSSSGSASTTTTTTPRTTTTLKG